MRNGYSATLVALVAFVCLFSSATDALAARTTAQLDGRVRSLSFSKTVPNRLNYQGYLVDSADSMAVTDTLVMTFRLYDAEMGGLEQWAETHPEVPVMGGMFTVLLGDVSTFPSDLFSGSTLWLQTEVGAEVLSPRRPLVSVAYSLRAQEADHATLADSAIVSGPVDYYVEEADLDHLDAADGDPDSALCVDDDGKVGIGTISPAARLDIRGTVNVGKDSSGHDVNFYGGEGYYGGARLFWYAYRMALRSGKDSDGTHWAPDSVGFFSLAAGIDTKAKGYASIAMGAHATARGEYSTALGVHSKASGLYSTAMGYDSEASGDYSMARGAGSIASGRTSTAAGWYTTASGRNSIAMGVWTTAGPADYTMAFGRGTSVVPITVWASGRRVPAVSFGSMAMLEGAPHGIMTQMRGSRRTSGP
jgi:hypothetical protein